jgi:Family of unknown function (DUF5681)
MAERENGRFKKGVSGNPGGRPKLPAEMREIFQAKAPEAFEVLCKTSARQRSTSFGGCGNADLGQGLRSAHSVHRHDNHRE